MKKAIGIFIVLFIFAFVMVGCDYSTSGKDVDIDEALPHYSVK